MAILDFLINKDNLQQQRDRAIDYAEEMYDPAIYNPQVNQAREQAVEGISEGQESIARRRTVESLFRPTDTSIYGGNQARAIAGQQARNRQAQTGLADFESNLTQQDIQAQQQGEQQFAQVRTKQKQTAAKQDAAIEEARMQYQQELENRRKQLGQTVANLAGTVAGSFLGPAGAAAGGALAGGLVGGGSGAVTGAGAGFTTSFQRQQSQDFLNQLNGGGDTQNQTDIGQMLSDVARQSVSTEQPQDEVIQPQIGSVGQQQTAQPMDMSQQQPQYDFTGGYQNTPSEYMTEQEQNQLLSTLGYDESGRKIQLGPQPETDQTIDQDFFEDFNFGSGDQQQQQTTQQSQLLGEQLYDPASNFIDKMFGPAGSYPFAVGTSLPRAGLNILDMFRQEYGQAQQRFQREQGMSQ